MKEWHGAETPMINQGLNESPVIAITARLQECVGISFSNLFFYQYEHSAVQLQPSKGADLLQVEPVSNLFVFYLEYYFLSLCGKGPNIGQVQSDLEPGSSHFQDKTIL